MKRTLAIVLSLMMILPCLAFVASAAGTPTAVYIDDINGYSSTRLGPILLYGAGKTAANFNVSSHPWWNKVLLKFNAADGSFVVTKVMPHAGVGDTAYTGVTLGDGEVMIMTHDTFDASYDAAIKNLAVGDKLYAYGFDFTNSAQNDMTDSSKVSSVAFTTYEPILGDDYYGYVAGGGNDDEDPEDPVVDSNITSLGASVNTALAGIRFGTEYVKDDNRGEVIALGTLLLPESKLGDNTLDLDYAATDDLVVNVLAKTISLDDYVEGFSFEEYDSFVYYVTIVGLDGHTDMDIAARPYITYKSNVSVTTYYGETLVRNINGVVTGAYDTVTPEPEPEPEPDPDDPDEPVDTTPDYASLTFVNGWDWSDSASYQNHIYLYASTNATATPASINGQGNSFLSALNGIVLEYNEANETWVVVDVDFMADGVNRAETATLGKNRLAVIFHNQAVIGQEDSFNFFFNRAEVGAEFVLTGDLTALQSVSGKIINVYLSIPSATVPTPEESTKPSDTSIGTVQSTVAQYTSNGNSTATSGDKDGLSCVLYAPQNNTVGISTYLNLAAVDTTLYTSSDALGKQSIGCGIASDKTIDNAYLYLCMNSTNWSGDFGLIKRLGDNDWEIITSEYKSNAWRWNAYAYISTVTVYHNPDYVYTRWNVMDGQNVYYIKNSNSIKDLKMELKYSGGKLTYSLSVGDTTIFSVSDTGTVSNARFGRAASITNSGTSTNTSSNYLDLISSTKNGRTPAELANVQFYNTYYYTSTTGKKLTLSAGTLWLYPSKTSSAGTLVNANGNPIVTCKEVTLTDGTVMDIIDIKNY